MSTNLHSSAFLIWYQELQELARRDELRSLISEPDGHLASYNKGLSPEEELAELEELAEWNGCACGG